MSDSIAYLRPEELDKLQTTLVEHMQTSNSLPIDVAHGFFTAVAALPDQVTPATARAHVLGEIAEEAGIDPILEKFQAQVLRDLESGQYGPLIMQMPRDDGSMLPIPYGWCDGFAQGLAHLDEALQARLFEDEQAARQLSALFAFRLYSESELFDPPDESAHREAVGNLGDAAVYLYRWWSSATDGDQ